MKQTLYELFDLLEQQHEGTISPEQKEAIDLAAPWAKRLEELAASPAEFDSIWSASMEIGQSDQPVWFARGFRLGMRLTLEALGEGEVCHRGGGGGGKRGEGV